MNGMISAVSVPTSQLSASMLCTGLAEVVALRV